jgi:hypothetical protein
MRQVVATLVTFFVAGSLAAVDWSSCTGALEGLTKRSKEAGSASTVAASAAEDLKEAKDDLERCRMYPDVYDLLRDNCRSKEWDLDSAESRMQSAAQEAVTQFRRLRSALGDAANACEVELTIAPPLTTLSPQGRCERLRLLRGQLSAQFLSDYCSTLMSQQECEICLGTN